MSDIDYVFNVAWNSVRCIATSIRFCTQDKLSQEETTIILFEDIALITNEEGISILDKIKENFPKVNLVLR